MFSPKKTPTKSAKPNGVDNVIHKLMALPPAIDLIVAAVLGGYSFVAIHVDNAKAVGLGCILIALLFALLGINAITREMKLLKQVEASSNPDALRGMKLSQFEAYLTALYGLDGYRVRSAIDELPRQDDADLIAVGKKQTLLIQFNHFDEDRVGEKQIQSLHKAAVAFRADGCVAITFGSFTPQAIDWARRKGVVLMGMEDVVAMAAKLTGKSAEEVAATPVKEEVVLEQQREIAEVIRGHHRFLFVDFVGVDHGFKRLGELLIQHPAYQVVASTIPTGTSLDELKRSFTDCGDRLIGAIEQSDAGRYFAIQKYLQATPEGKQAVWLAIDASPRLFPEGCSELIAINRAFGFDQSASTRLVDAMLLVDRRLAA